MASITITIPDSVVNRVLDAIAARHGYNPDTDGTKAQFAKMVLLRWLKNEVVHHESATAGARAAADQATAATSEIILS